MVWVPTPQETMVDASCRVHDLYLIHILRFAKWRSMCGYHSVDCFGHLVACYDTLSDEASHLYEDIACMSYRQARDRVVPFLLRLGYSVTYHPDGKEDYPFRLFFPGHSPTVNSLPKGTICL